MKLLNALIQIIVFVAGIALSSATLTGQTIYFTTAGAQLYSFEPDNCNTSLITNSLLFYDIAVDTDGNIYGITQYGELQLVDPSTGNSTTIYDFPANTNAPIQIWNSLTADAQGMIYAAGDQGYVASYDLVSGLGVYYGDIGPGASGDLTFFQGELYAATYGNQIFLVNLDNPSSSSVVFSGSISDDIFGIITYSEGCTGAEIYATTSTFNGSDFYSIDFETGTSSLICSLPYTVYGGASTFEVLSSNPIDISEPEVVDAICGAANGSINIQASFPDGDLEFQLNNEPVQTTGFFENLVGGSYTVFLASDNGCESEIEVQVGDVSIQLQDPSVVGASCGQSDGSIEVFITSDNLIVEYSIDGNPPQSDAIFSELTTGDYEIEVSTDDCSETLTVNVPNLDGLVIDDIQVQNDICNLGIGFIDITASIASGSINYMMNGVDQSNGLFQNLFAGPVFIEVSSGTCILTENLTLTSENGLSLDEIITSDDFCSNGAGSIEVSAAPTTGAISYFLNGAPQTETFYEGLTGGDYLIEVVLGDCIESEEVSIISTPPVSIEEVLSTPTTCNEQNGVLEAFTSGGTAPLSFTMGGTQFTGVFSDLAAGDYTMSVTDEYGCGDQANGTVESIEALSISATDFVDPICGDANGIITMITSDEALPHSFTLNGNSVSDGTIIGLGPGNYSLVVLDANNCAASQEFILEDQSELELISLSTTNSDCDVPDGKIELFVIGEIEPVAYFVNGESYDNNLIQGLSAGNYNVLIEDGGGCIQTAEAVIGSPPCLEIYVPNAFTPDQDNINETFFPVLQPSFRNQVDDFLFEVYNRWGNVIFSTEDPFSRGWLGEVNGGGYFTQNEVYVWRLEYSIESTAFAAESLMGYVTVVR